MLTEQILTELRDLIQVDVGQRGLRTDPASNLINACPDDFRHACQSLAEHAAPTLAIVTGFFIPTGEPPAGETDGPLGALYLARALCPLGISVVLVTDEFCVSALAAGLALLGLSCPIVTLPPTQPAGTAQAYWQHLEAQAGPLTHLLAIERVGPNHADNRCHTMRGRDITDLMSPAHLLFDHAPHQPNLTTIGIGDGGNEIGMGKIPRHVIERNIPRGGLIACRVPTQHLIVCGVSNWGAYALAAGVHLLRDREMDANLLDPQCERQLLQIMVEHGPLVDGVLGKPSVSVDGLSWETYADVMVKIGEVMKAARAGR